MTNSRIDKKGRYAKVKENPPWIQIMGGQIQQYKMNKLKLNE